MPVVQYIFFFLVLLITSPLWATPYFVAPSGSDTINNGLSTSTPFRTIQKCVDVMISGDSCTVADGTYQGTSGTRTVVISGKNNITLRSTNYLGATVVPTNGAAQQNHAIAIVSSTNITLENFDIDGSTNTATTGSNLNYQGLYLAGDLSGTIIQDMEIHHIARNLCLATQNTGTNGIFAEGASNYRVDQLTIYANGRRRANELGCSASSPNYGDHGVYMDGGSNQVYTRTVFYDNVNGYDFQIFSSNGLRTAINTTIHNNTFGYHLPTVAPLNEKPVAITIYNANGVSLRNNISNQSPVGMLNCDTSASNVVARFNRTSGSMYNSNLCGGTSFGNTTSSTSSLAFTDVAARDFRLNPGSVAIDGGEAGLSPTLPFNGSAIDQGALESGTVPTPDTTPPAAPTGLSVE